MRKKGGPIMRGFTLGGGPIMRKGGVRLCVDKSGGPQACPHRVGNSFPPDLLGINRVRLCVEANSGAG